MPWAKDTLFIDVSMDAIIVSITSYFNNESTEFVIYSWIISDAG